MIGNGFAGQRWGGWATRLAVGLLAGLSLIASACQVNRGERGVLWLGGTLEGSQVSIVSEVGGRVVEVAVDEGESVQAGQVLIALDDAALQAQLKQAQAAVRAAEANLAQVTEGARPEEIAAAQAALAQAQAERDGMALAARDAARLLTNPQQLQAQLDAAGTAVKLAEQEVAVAQSELAQARWWREFQGDDKARRESLDKQVAIAQRQLEAAQAQLEGATAQFKALQAMRRAPVTLQAQANSARSAYDLALAGVSVAEAALAELKAGPTSHELALAEAQLHQAQAQLWLARTALARTRLHAPLAGVVSSRSVHVGETIQPGLVLMTATNLDMMTLVVYVPQAQLPQVQLGAPVQVTADAYPDQPFAGRVVFIARRAQFSSRDTQARQDRANVVFAVKVRVPNANHRLKAGMTADVALAIAP